MVFSKEKKKKNTLYLTRPRNHTNPVSRKASSELFVCLTMSAEIRHKRETDLVV